MKCKARLSKKERKQLFAVPSKLSEKGNIRNPTESLTPCAETEHWLLCKGIYNVQWPLEFDDCISIRK